MNKVLQNLDAENQKEAQKIKKNQQLLVGIIVIAIFLILGIIYYFQKKRKQQQALFQKYIRTKEDKEKSLEAEKTNEAAKISSEVEDNILLQLQKFEESEKYLDSSITLPALATKLKTNTKYLSEIIKTHKNQNFNSYINALRIDYISNKILTDEIFRKYKISYLAEHCGFSSADTFSKIFKDNTGVSPSVFIKNAHNNLKEN